MKYLDVTGQRFGRLTVVERLTNRSTQVYYRCRCDCGRETTVRKGHLVGGDTVSCGCWRRGKANVGPRPSVDHPLARLDPDGLYQPGNVRCVPSPVQQGNERDTHARWVWIMGISGATIRARRLDPGQDGEPALSTVARSIVRGE